MSKGPTPEQVERFSDALGKLCDPEERLGLAVSGGPDSLALLLLAQASHPGRIAVATIDHGLRKEAADEAAAVAALCDERGLDHVTLQADWPDGMPTRNVQAAARAERYRLLGQWASAHGIGVVATAHHADDQAETLLMRLARGAGLAGLAGVRPVRRLDDGLRIIRPLLGWRKSELEALVAEAGVNAAQDPSNSDPSFDRARLRSALADAGFDNVEAFAASAGHLAEAEEALAWMVERLADVRLHEQDGDILLEPGAMPAEILRRIMIIAFERRGEKVPRGPDLARAIETLRRGDNAMLGHTLVKAERNRWRLTDAPPRTH